MNELLKLFKDPELLELGATLVSLAPGKEAQIGAGALRLAAAFIRAGIKAEEIDLALARYSAEAQQIALDWK